MRSKRGGILEKMGRKATISGYFIALDFWEDSFNSSYTIFVVYSVVPTWAVYEYHQPVKDNHQGRGMPCISRLSP